MAACVYCRCERLGAVREPLELGAPVLCGACGSLMVLDVDEAERPFVRRPTPVEALELHRDPDVVRWLDAYAMSIIESSARASTKHKGRVIARPGRLTAHGPDWRP